MTYMCKPLCTNYHMYLHDFYVHFAAVSARAFKRSLELNCSCQPGCALLALQRLKRSHATVYSVSDILEAAATWVLPCSHRPGTVRQERTLYIDGDLTQSMPVSVSPTIHATVHRPVAYHSQYLLGTRARLHAKVLRQRQGVPLSCTLGCPGCTYCMPYDLSFSQAVPQEIAVLTAV